MTNLDPNHSDWSTERPPVYHPGHDSPYPVFHTYERDREVYTAPFAQQTLGPPSRPVSTSRHGDNRGGGYYGFDYYDNYPGAPRGLNPDWQAAHGVGTVHGWYEQTGLNGFYGMERPGGPLRPPRAFAPLVDQQAQRFGHAGHGPRSYQRPDERIEEEVYERLLHRVDINAADIEVAAQGGIVTLSGNVDTRHSQRLAEELADEVRGVHEVRNELNVRTQTQGVSHRR